MYRRFRPKVQYPLQEGRRRKFLGSRYALRELEGAIGYDCRRLEDGRKAVFRHTDLHKKARRDFFDWRDNVAVMQSVLSAVSAISSHGRTDFKSAVEIVENTRMDLISSAFPYLFSGKSRPLTRTETIDELFDQLDEIVAKEKAEKSDGKADK